MELKLDENRVDLRKASENINQKNQKLTELELKLDQIKLELRCGWINPRTILDGRARKRHDFKFRPCRLKTMILIPAEFALQSAVCVIAKLRTYIIESVAKYNSLHSKYSNPDSQFDVLISRLRRLYLVSYKNKRLAKRLYRENKSLNKKLVSVHRHYEQETNDRHSDLNVLLGQKSCELAASLQKIRVADLKLEHVQSELERYFLDTKRMTYLLQVKESQAEEMKQIISQSFSLWSSHE